MKKLIKNSLKGAMIMSILACGYLVQANTLEPKVTIHQKQVSSNQVNLEIGVKGLSEQVVAVEVSVVANDIKDMINMEPKVKDGYTTYQLKTLDDGQEKLTCYLVSSNQDEPFALSENQLDMAMFSLKTDGKLKFSTNDISVKVIEVGYQTKTYSQVEMLESETDNESDEDNGNNDGNQNPDNNTGGNDSPSKPEMKPENVFKDVKNHWASDSIINMANKGIIKGYVDGTFRPSANITRGEFATLLARAFNIQAISGTNPFKDVLVDKWYTESILALYDAGITTGRTDGTFGVNENITNEEICAMIYRTIQVLKLNVPGINSRDIYFTDQDKISTYAKEAVAALTKVGIIQGRPDGSLRPQSTTIRAQVAVILERVLKITG